MGQTLRFCVGNSFASSFCLVVRLLEYGHRAWVSLGISVCAMCARWDWTVLIFEHILDMTDGRVSDKCSLILNLYERVFILFALINPS